MVQQNCFEEPVSSPTGDFRCVPTNATIEKFRVAPQYSFKSELARRHRVVVPHSEQHPAVTTGRRAVSPVLTELKFLCSKV